MAGGNDDLNIRGTFLHMAADAGVSPGVVSVGPILLATGWRWLDPVVSMAIVAVILVGTRGPPRDSVNPALDSVPEDIDIEAVAAYLAALPGVAGVHDLHTWALSTTETALTAHLVIPGGHNGDASLARTSAEPHDRFGIERATMPIEHGDPAHPWGLAPTRVDWSGLPHAGACAAPSMHLRRNG